MQLFNFPLKWIWLGWSCRTIQIYTIENICLLYQSTGPWIFVVKKYWRSDFE